MNATVCPASFLDVSKDELRPMTGEESQEFAVAISADDSAPGNFNGITNLMPYPTIVKKLNDVGVDLTHSALLTVVAWSSGSPGDLLLWGYTLSQIAKNKQTTLIKRKDITREFPDGIPNDAARRKIWEAQKVPYDERETGRSDNYLDNTKYWS